MDVMFSYTAMHLPWPVDWSSLFGRVAPLVLEIGFGNGKFLADLAQQHPDWNLVGIERAHDPLKWTEALIAKRALTNVRLINGDALMSLHCLFEPASLSQIHLNFSDPWPKKRHHERRVINPRFLQALASRLALGAEVLIATDIEQYAGEIGVALSQTQGLKNAYASPWMMQRENPSVITAYEAKAINEGRPCHYFKYRRTAETLPLLPVYTEFPMPNVHLQLPFSLEKALHAFEGQLYRHEDRIVKTISAYQEAKRPTLLFEVQVEEALFSQHLAIRLSQRSDGSYLLAPSPLGYPRATRGVQDAVFYLAEWLVNLEVGAQVLEGAIKPPHAKD
jgi:tRNA (guanine-N7-)-methyltransferase